MCIVAGLLALASLFVYYYDGFNSPEWLIFGGLMIIVFAIERQTSIIRATKRENVLTDKEK